MQLSSSLLLSWHPKKNLPLLPKEVSAHSNKKVWWVCKKQHVWIASIGNRSNGSGCPYCAGKLVSKENSLAARFPIIACQLLIDRSGVSPSQITWGSNRICWWICKKGHQWQASVVTRTAGHGCPYCSGRKVGSDNNLAVLFPDLRRQWHPHKNGNISAEMVVPGSKFKAWWLCKQGHEWQAQVALRTRRKTGCPICKHHRANKLGSIDSNLLKEWDTKKNIGIDIDQYTAGSQKKVWWVCRMGHSWQTSIKIRTGGSGCPFCRGKSSKLEIRILSEFRKLFPKVEWRKKIVGLEADIFIPSLKLVVEVDGYPWHLKSVERDRSKSRSLIKLGYRILRVRHDKLLRLSKSDIFFSDSNKDIQITADLVENILLCTNPSVALQKKLLLYIERKKICNDAEYRKLLSLSPAPEYSNSLEARFPQVIEEWDKAKNGPLTPVMVSSGSKKRVWWKCKEGHSWEEEIVRRAIGGYGCPYCSGRRLTRQNSLGCRYPSLVHEWDSVRNSVSPYEVAPMSGQSAWWICKNGHHFKARIASRALQQWRCPYCSNKIVSENYNLEKLYPEIALTFDLSRNKGRKPSLLFPMSNEMFWWKCSSGHIWQAPVCDRTGGHGCPFCTGKKVDPAKSLYKMHPLVTKEWDINKNLPLTPKTILPGSRKKVWWLCKNSHSWQTVVSSRTLGGHGCPFCAGQKASQTNNLQITHPKLALEWDSKRNGSLTPEMVTYGSNKNVWWRCQNGHRWKKQIKQRSRGISCPECK